MVLRTSSSLHYDVIRSDINNPCLVTSSDITSDDVMGRDDDVIGTICSPIYHFDCSCVYCMMLTILVV